METWKKIPKLNNEYEVSNTGKIRSVDGFVVRSNGKPYFRKSKQLKTYIPTNGYEQGAASVNKKLQNYKIHRLVAEAFIPNPLNKEEVNHIDGNKLNNNVSNLEWCTRQENIAHSIENKLQTPFKGEEVGNSILKEADVLYIRQNYKPRILTRKSLAEMFGVKECTIKDVLSRRSWKHLP